MMNNINEELRKKRIEELLSIPQEELIARYLLQEQKLYELSNLMNKLREYMIEIDYENGWRYYEYMEQYKQQNIKTRQ